MGFYDDYLTRTININAAKRPVLIELLERLQKTLRINEYELTANTFRGIAEYICKHIVDKYPFKFNDGELADLFHVLEAIDEKRLAPKKIVDELFLLRMDNKGSHQGDRVSGHDVAAVMPVLPNVIQYLTDHFPREINTEGKFREIAAIARSDENTARRAKEAQGRAIKKIVLIVILAALAAAAYKFGKPVLEKVLQSMKSGEPAELNIGTGGETEAGAEAETEGAASAGTAAGLVDDSEISNMQKKTVAAAEASTSLTGNTNYTADRCIDGDIATNWQEGVEGFGEGSTLLFRFEEETEVQFIRVRNGSAVDDEHYFGNGRPREIGIRAGEETWNVTLEDVNAYQTIALPERVKTAEITLVIESVYPGEKWQDTAISEVEFY